VTLTSFIAKRYFFARSNSNAVNIITAISVGGITVATAALIVVLSAFNGLEDLVRGFYQDFDPDLKIEKQGSKFFELEELPKQWPPAVVSASPVLEEKALLSFREREYIATLKGVSTDFNGANKLNEHIIYGQYALQNQGLSAQPALIGAGVAYYLGFGQNDLQQAVDVFLPTAKNNPLDLSQSFRSERIYPLGAFSIQPEFDEQYVLVPLPFMEVLLQREGQISAVELQLSDYDQVAKVQGDLKKILGPDYRVLNRDEQQVAFLKVMRTEGLFTFFVFALILLIAVFTIAGSLTMSMFEKRSNLFTLWSVGAELKDLRRVFFRLGMLIALVGAIAGISIGTVLVLGQEHFGFIRVGQGYLIEAYPVSLRWADVVLVSITVFALSAAASLLTASRLGLALLKTR
jgi:lipoprotein-releasing system permease protein